MERLVPATFGVIYFNRLRTLQDNLSKSNLGLSQVVDDNELAIIEIEQSIQALNSIKVKKRRLISLLSGDE